MKMLKYLVITMMFLGIMTGCMTVMAQNNYEFITNVAYLSPTAIVGTEGGDAEVGITVSVKDDANIRYDTVSVRNYIYKSDKTTFQTESGFALKMYYQYPNEPRKLHMTDSNPSNHLDAGHNFQTSWIGTGDVKYWTVLTLPASTTQNTTWIKMVVEEYELSSSNPNEIYGTYWFKITIQDNLTFYNIDLSASALEDTIRPEETIYHKLTLANSGTYRVPIGLFVEPTLEDKNGNDIDLNNTDWSIKIYDSTKTVETYYLSPKAGGSTTCYLRIQAPEKAKTEPQSELTIKITAKVLNNSKYGDTLTVGGDDFKTSTEFTGGDGNWYDINLDDLGLTSGTMILVYIVVAGFILALGYYWFGRNKRTGRTKYPRNKRR